ncbi:MAG: heme-binding protein [Pseudomonadota bacterium]
MNRCPLIPAFPALAPAPLIAAGPAVAEDDEDAVMTYSALKPDFAIKAAEGAMIACRDAGYQVGVAVVDRTGLLQAFVRDRFAGAHTVETSRRKAWTAVSFRTNTTDLDPVTRPDAEAYGIRFISEALPLGGGVLIESGGVMVGAIGVSGAPGPHLDDDCAEAGIAAIEDALGF